MGSIELNLQSIGPLTLLAAVTPFFLKEMARSILIRRSNLRQRAALRILVGHECRANYHTLSSIRHVLQIILPADGTPATHACHFVFSRSGRTLLRYHSPGAEHLHSCVLATTRKELMARYILDVALRDEYLYPLLQSAYEAIEDLEQLRERIIYFLDPDAGNALQSPRQLVDASVAELQSIQQHLAALYLACTQQQLVRGLLP